MNILLTGCAGFIGSNLLDRLLQDGHKVIGIDDFNDYYSPSQKQKNISHNLKHQNFNLITADISSSGLHQRINTLTHQRIDTVVHLAARAGVRASIKEPLLY
ncbi:MAG: GDP-mannose 4,6-dehydratase, partial [Patescibacteria group bacterium]